MDSNYEHIAAWHEAFRSKGVEIPKARIHRCVGMSGRLMLRALFRELGRNIGLAEDRRIGRTSQEKFRKKIVICRHVAGRSRTSEGFIPTRR